MADDLMRNKKAAYFTGCFHNYYYPEAGKATAAVLQRNGITLAVPDQVCCALPMVSKGNYADAERNMKFNLKKLAKLVNQGYVVIVSCSSCGLFIKEDYPIYINTEDAHKVADNLYHVTEYLLKLDQYGLLDKNFDRIDKSVFYHTPCHLRAQGLGQPSVKLLQMLPGVSIKKISEECCGMSGAYGYEKVNYDLASHIGQKLGEDIRDNTADLYVTDCGGCRLQIRAVGGKEALHPMVVLSVAYGLKI